MLVLSFDFNPHLEFYTQLHRVLREEFYDKSDVPVRVFVHPATTTMTKISIALKSDFLLQDIPIEVRPDLLEQGKYGIQVDTGQLESAFVED